RGFLTIWGRFGGPSKGRGSVQSERSKLRRVHQLAPSGLLRGALTFQTYRKLASLAVATVRPALRVARFRAERTFSLLSANSAKGTLMAEPSFSMSRSL